MTTAQNRLVRKFKEETEKLLTGLYVFNEGTVHEYRNSAGLIEARAYSGGCDLELDLLRVHRFGIQATVTFEVELDMGLKAHRDDDYVVDNQGTIAESLRMLALSHLGQAHTVHPRRMRVERDAEVQGVVPVNLLYRLVPDGTTKVKRAHGEPIKTGTPAITQNPGEQPKENWEKQPCKDCMEVEGSPGPGCRACRFHGFILIPATVQTRATTKKKRTKRAIRL